MNTMKKTMAGVALIVMVLCLVMPVIAKDHPVDRPVDPGVRDGGAGAGGSIPGLTAQQIEFFQAGLDDFLEITSVQGEQFIPNTEPGLGPTFNLDSCGGCHKQPATGGTSPAINPQIEVATLNGANNRVPFFITANGPIREARFKFVNPPFNTIRDGGVHDVFTIAGRVDAPGCALAQPDFVTAAAEHNIIFRIPTPVFGAGLIEMVPDSVILANKNSNLMRKKTLGISGHENREGNTGTITRFGWKAQNKSLLMFSGEAYDVEMGVTNELFQDERSQDPFCLFNTLPEDTTNTTNFLAVPPTAVVSGIERFSIFMRFLAPPTPTPDTPSIANGRALFNFTGCSLCHTPSLVTGPTTVAALSKQPVNLFSDLLVHNMGPGLADDIIQGNAGPDEFRTAPLWGLGQRIFFLHDGRTRDLLDAIQAHKSSGNHKFSASEANAVIDDFNDLPRSQKQDLLNFLRSL